MSCQQVSRLITTNATTLSTPAAIATPEDPYVFTETVPTTPPILFNTQKSRCRLTDSQFTSATKLTNQNQKLPLAQLHDNITKTQASYLGASHASATTTASITTANLKNVTQSQCQKLQSKRITTNVCVVRPQLQQKQPPQQQQQQQHKQQKKQQTATPLLSHTPSLWQTPLLLDTAPVSTATGNPATSPVTTFSSPKSTQTAAAAVAGTPSTTPANLLASPVSANANATATATAMVSPMISPSTTPLPPSKFHNTTLAQHLQKVQCIKKPKKSPSPKQQQQPRNGVDKQLSTRTAPPPLHAFTEPATQHSDASDLNEIPVNVIFRKPQKTSEIKRTLIGASGDGTDNDSEAIKCKSAGTAVVTATIAPPINNKLKSVKVIAPTVKTTLPAAPTAPTITQPLAVGTTGVHAVKDVIFVQPQAKQQATDSALYRNNNSKKSSKAVAFSKSTDCVAIPAYFKATIPDVATHSHNKFEKSLKTDALYATPLPPPLCKVATVPAHKVASKHKPRKLTAPLIRVAQKRNRKPFASLFKNERTFAHVNIGCGFNSTAVAVVKLSAEEVNADTSLLSSATVLPYCLQQHWLDMCDTNTLLDHASVLMPNGQREDRIAQHKTLLRRQALQLLTTRSLQRLPLHAARRRLMCVDRLLQKYRNHNENDRPAKMCTTLGCHSQALELAAYCQQHINNNGMQHIFLPCTAKFADNTQCRIPVFDISHDLSLCSEHTRKRDAYNRNLFEQRPRKVAAALPMMLQKVDLQRQWQQQQLQLHQQQEKQQMQRFYNKKTAAISTTTTTVTPMRKRRSAAGGSPNPVGRPQKRARKTPTAVTSTLVTLLPKSAVLQRKNSTTSLESIASNSYSSNSQPMQSLQHEHQQSASSNSLPPALAPLSGVSAEGGPTRTVNFGTSAIVAADLKEHKINEIVTQLAMVAATNSNNNSSNGNCNSNSNNNINSLSFANTNSNSNFTSSGMGSSSSLPSASDELLTQDMLSICENSSVYPSSEDTGLGGLSETELIAAAPDADEIPLADARFFFDDLANVINAMPADAFNELFTTVHQDEREEVERALEIADKHLKTLQQTIGTESDFLGDFLNVNDDILPDAADICSKMGIVSSVMHSPETSNIDSAALFADSDCGSGSGSASSVVGASTNNTNCAPAVDVRGLVQT